VIFWSTKATKTLNKNRQLIYLTGTIVEGLALSQLLFRMTR
jgi:hypothetical protein